MLRHNGASRKNYTRYVMQDAIQTLVIVIITHVLWPYTVLVIIKLT